MMAATKKSTKAELTAAFDAGVDARKDWNGETATMPECEYPEGPLLTAWSSGWKGRDDLEKTQAEQSSEESTFSGDEQLIAQGHHVDDPHVVEHSVQLAQLMTAFDNHGVQIVEEQWRALSDNEQTVAAKWANDMRIGDVRPCPEFLLKFATEELKASSAKHHEVQKEMQSTLFPCEFKKPSRSKLDESGEYKVTVNMKVDRDRVRLTRAEELWGWVRNKIEFGAIPCSEWQPQLPGMDNPKVITCEADVIKFGWTKGGYTFGFRVGQETLSIEDAMALWDGEKGSCRMTPLGDPEPEAEVEQEESTASLIAKSRPLPSGPSLFDGKDESTEEPYRTSLTGDSFMAPDEFYVRTHHAECAAFVTVGESEGKFYGSRSCNFMDKNSEVQEADWMYPKKEGDGFITLEACVESELGRLIEYATQENAIDGFVIDLKDALKQLTNGVMLLEVSYDDDEDGEDDE